VTTELFVLLDDREVGRLTRDTRGRCAFAYDEDWRWNADAYPLSVSMPLAAQAHAGDVVAAYLWGLLPDNDVILDSWAKRFKVSARNPFDLLANVGEDCPGAVRFVTAERRAMLDRPRKGKIDWLDDHAIAERLRALHRDPAAWRSANDTGQFSLGGAQPKTALFFDDERWGVPSGRLPTTHILKPGAPHLDGHAENEHFCLRLAREAGLPVAGSRIVHFEDEVAICVERYDRQRLGQGVLRVHQEDCCQALGVLPVNKYENAGGPGARAIANLLRERSTSAVEDLETLIGALAFNWLIAGTDAHAKNYSILIGRGGGVRLAPLYDVASFLPYAAHGIRKLTLAMKIGGTYRLHEVGAYQWTKLGADLALDPEELRTTIAKMCRALPDQAADVLRRTLEDGLAHTVLPGLTERIQDRARACAAVLFEK
jgi:serine/threonine-protein kinase HipA